MRKQFKTSLIGLAMVASALCSTATTSASQTPPELRNDEYGYFDTPNSELKLFVQGSTQQEYANAKATHDAAQKRDTELTAQFVNVGSQSVTVRLLTGNDMTIQKSSIGDDEVEYLGYVSNIDAAYYVFSYFGYETGDGECFVSATNGKLFHTGYNAIVSPNKDMLVTYYASPEGEDSATIEVYDLNSGNVVFLCGLWSRTLLPYDIRIGQDDTLYIKAYKTPWNDQEFVYYKLPLSNM